MRRAQEGREQEEASRSAGAAKERDWQGEQLTRLLGELKAMQASAAEMEAELMSSGATMRAEL